MALAGVAMAAPISYTDANSWLDTYLDDIYTAGDSFTLSFDVTEAGSAWSTGKALLTMAEDYHVTFQYPTYLALSYVTNGGKAPDGVDNNTDPDDISWDAPSPLNNVNTFNVSGKTYQWIGFANDGTTHLGAADKGFSITGGSVTLTYVAGGESILEIYSVENNVTEKVVFASGTLSLDAKDLEIGGMASTIDNATFTTGGQTYSIPVAPGVPEPTTATLSLLALAGLAARRRRK